MNGRFGSGPGCRRRCSANLFLNFVDQQSPCVSLMAKNFQRGINGVDVFVDIGFDKFGENELIQHLHLGTQFGCDVMPQTTFHFGDDPLSVGQVIVTALDVAGSDGVAALERKPDGPVVEHQLELLRCGGQNRFPQIGIHRRIVHDAYVIGQKPGRIYL